MTTYHAIDSSLLRTNRKLRAASAKHAAEAIHAEAKLSMAEDQIEKLQRALADAIEAIEEVSGPHALKAPDVAYWRSLLGEVTTDG